MTLVSDIQDLVTTPSVRVADVLRKCQILAFRLKHEPLKQWVDQELNGYSEAADVPEYRVLKHLPVKGEFRGPFGSGYSNMDVPVFGLPESIKAKWTTITFRKAISECESVVEGLAATEEKQMRRPWPPELTQVYLNNMSEGPGWVQAWNPIPQQMFVGIVDAVRNRILAFCLELEEELPEIGTGAPSNEVQERIVSQVFNNHIWGGTNNIVAASSDFSQVAYGPPSGSMTPEQLHDKVMETGIPAEAAEELKDLIITEKPDPETKKFGPKVSEWIGAAMTKILSGAWDVSVKVGAEVLPKLIGHYYGIDLDAKGK